MLSLWGHYGNQYDEWLKNLERERAHGPAIPILHLHWKEPKSTNDRNNRTSALSAALLAIARKWNHVRYTSMDGWIQKHVIHAYNGIYSAVIKNEMVEFSGKWVQLKITVRRNKPDLERQTAACFISYVKHRFKINNVYITYMPIFMYDLACFLKTRKRNIHEGKDKILRELGTRKGSVIRKWKLQLPLGKKGNQLAVKNRRETRQRGRVSWWHRHSCRERTAFGEKNCLGDAKCISDFCSKFSTHEGPMRAVFKHFICTNVHTYVLGVCWGQHKASDPLEAELQMVVRHQVGAGNRIRYKSNKCS